MRYLFLLSLALLGVGASWAAAPQGMPTAYGIFTHVRVAAPYLAMTFDDGPSAQSTPQLLDPLKARRLKATCFLVGQNVQAHPELVRRIVADGHEVGNHTWDHPQLSKPSDEQATAEIQKTQAAIQAACGVIPRLLRPPVQRAQQAPAHVDPPSGCSSTSSIGRWTPRIGSGRARQPSPVGCLRGRGRAPSFCSTTFTPRRSTRWPRRLMGC